MLIERLVDILVSNDVSCATEVDQEVSRLS